MTFLTNLQHKCKTTSKQYHLDTMSSHFFRPETQAYLQKVEREKQERQRGEQGDNRSFLSKYVSFHLCFPRLLSLKLTLFSGCTSFRSSSYSCYRVRWTRKLKLAEAAVVINYLNVNVVVIFAIRKRNIDRSIYCFTFLSIKSKHILLNRKEKQLTITKYGDWVPDFRNKKWHHWKREFITKNAHHENLLLFAFLRFFSRWFFLKKRNRVRNI